MCMACGSGSWGRWEVSAGGWIRGDDGGAGGRCGFFDGASATTVMLMMMRCCTSSVMNMMLGLVVCQVRLCVVKGERAAGCVVCFALIVIVGLVGCGGSRTRTVCLTDVHLIFHSVKSLSFSSFVQVDNVGLQPTTSSANTTTTTQQPC